MRQRTEKTDMDRIKLIFLALGFSLLVRGQEIGNYVANGSFEKLYNCTSQPQIMTCFSWSCIDSIKPVAQILHKCWGNVPVNGVGYQNPKDGEAYARLTFWCPICPSYFSRSNIKNRLKNPLESGKTYCVKMYVSCQDQCPQAISNFGFYFGDTSIDTIIHNARLPLTFLNPQVENSNNNIIVDSMNWVPITGTFTANGTEKYLLVSNFRSDVTTNTVLTGYMPANGWAEYFVDAISCTELNLPAYAGPDKPCIPGDSVFIGRKPDFAIDLGCIWYKLPNMVTAIDTISGLWVKPTTTSTYVVSQELDCSPLKWDTVVVFMDAVGLKDLGWYSDNIKLFPNPTETDLTVTFGNQADINRISIINSIGQTIREEDLQINNTQFTVSTSDLDKGIYLIQFRTSAGTVTKTFVKN